MNQHRWAFNLSSSQLKLHKMNKPFALIWIHVHWYSFNKTEAAVFSCRLCFLRAFPFISLICIKLVINNAFLTTNFFYILDRILIIKCGNTWNKILSQGLYNSMVVKKVINQKYFLVKCKFMLCAMVYF